MSIPNRNKLESDLTELIRKFLDEHPDAKEALDLFGIAFEQYQQSLAAQQGPVFYTGTSTD